MGYLARSVVFSWCLRRVVKPDVAAFAGVLLGVSGCNALLGLERRQPPAPLKSDPDAGTRASGASSGPDASLMTGSTNASSDCEPEKCGAETTTSATCVSEVTCLENTTRALDSGGPRECLGPACKTAGASCDVDAECVEGLCASAPNGSGVCCVANCDAPCQACAENGRECVSLVDAVQCGEIQCPEDTTCIKYTQTSVTRERCVDGACGAPEVLCAFVARNEGKPCSDDRLCDDAGNCTVPKLKLGVACDASEQCELGYCVDGVCCESDCDGTCMNCRPGTGKCDVLPEDDEQCPQIACEPRDSLCATALGDITGARCARVGACKSTQDCPFDFAPKGTFCYGDQLCDGKGHCAVPEVDCGTSTCGGFGELGCCVHTTNPELATPVCSTTSECLVQYDDWLVGCDEHSDCDIAEELCCALVHSGGGHTYCMPAAECNHAYSGPISLVELCDSPAMGSIPCSTGLACNVTSETLVGYGFCRLP